MSQHDHNELRSPEIDGLRAIAILGVLLFHVQFNWIQRGFLGVDVFFVISGFLITKRIFKLQEKGSFSYLDFYKNRIRRLFPALFVTILLTFTLGAILITPDGLSQLSQASIFSIFPFSNILYWSQSGYFDSSASSKPLLHTWSLGVEEQFYFFWPFFIGLIFKLRKKEKAAWFFILLGLLSFSGAFYLREKDPSTAFYWMPFRIFQFCFGALAVCISDIKLSLKRWQEEGLLLLALVLMCVPMFLSKERLPVSEVILSLLVSIGAMVAILTGKAQVFGFLLKNRLCGWIGRVSYSVYLVHWPLNYYIKYRTYDLTRVDFETPLSLYWAYGALSGAFLLGVFLHYFIELPFWRGSGFEGKLFGQRKKNWAIAFTLLFVGVLANAYFSKGWLWRY